MWGIPTPVTAVTDELLKEVYLDLFPENPLTQETILKFLAQTASHDSMWIFFEEEEFLQCLLERLLVTLNGGVSVAHKTDALFLVAKLAHSAPPPHLERILDALQSLGGGFEEVMERESHKLTTDYASANVRGRSKLLELMLITLCRLRRYNLTAQELLQFTNSSERLATALVQSVLEALNLSMDIPKPALADSRHSPHKSPVTRRNLVATAAVAAYAGRDFVAASERKNGLLMSSASGIGALTDKVQKMEDEDKLLLAMVRLLRGFTEFHSWYGADDQENEGERSLLEFVVKVQAVAERCLSTGLLDALAGPMQKGLFAQADAAVAAAAAAAAASPISSPLRDPAVARQLSMSKSTHVISTMYHLMMESVVGFLLQTHVFLTDQAAALVHHLTNEATLLQRVVRPYAEACIAAIPDYLAGHNLKGVNDPNARQLPVALRGITLCLRLLAVCSFRQTGAVHWEFRRLNFTAELLTQGRRWMLKENMELCASVLLLNINIDSLRRAEGAAEEAQVKAMPPETAPGRLHAAIAATLEEVGEASRATLYHMLTRTDSGMQVSRDVETYRLIWELLEPSAEAEPAPEAVPEPVLEPEPEPEPAPPVEATPAPEPEGEQPPPAPSPEPPKSPPAPPKPKVPQKKLKRCGGGWVEVIEKAQKTAGLAVPPSAKFTYTMSSTKHVQEASFGIEPTFLTRIIVPPDEILCAINRHVMKQPVQLPCGVFVERDTAMLWIQEGKPCPFTGAELVERELGRAKEIETKIWQWQIARTALDATDDADDGKVETYGFGNLSVATDSVVEYDL